MSLPLFGTVLETAMLFTANGYLKRRLRETHGLHPDAELPMSYVLYAGAGTGFCVSWVLTPIELIKCRMQVAGQPIDVSATAGKGHVGMAELRHPMYSGPLDCVVRALREDGLRILYRGHLGTLLREIPGTAGWFGAYETFLRTITPPGVKRSELHPGFIVTAGALGGMTYWAAMYPADTVKSAMQTVGAGGSSSFLGTLAEIYKVGGLRALYAGISPTIIRAAPSNAVIFLAYEESAKIFTRLLGLESA